jgi:hypothetical protein
MKKKCDTVVFTISQPYTCLAKATGGSRARQQFGRAVLVPAMTGRNGRSIDLSHPDNDAKRVAPGTIRYRL